LTRFAALINGEAIMNPLWLLAVGVIAAGVVFALARRRETKTPTANDSTIPAKQ